MLPWAAMAWRVGVDVGGTFTDLAAVDDAGGAVRLEKVPTTPADQSLGVAAGLAALLARHGVPPAAVTYLGHGTTVCLNAVLERKGARTGLVTTQGMRDLLELRRQTRDDLYDLQADKPEPLGLPEIRLLLSEELAVVDNLSGKLHLIVYADPSAPDAYGPSSTAHAQPPGPGFPEQAPSVYTVVDTSRHLASRRALPRTTR